MQPTEGTVSSQISTMSTLEGTPYFVMSAQQSASIAIQQLTLTIVSFTLVVYDHAITFAQEVTFFWASPWSPSRILYLSVRPLRIILVIFELRISSLGLNWLPILDYAVRLTVMVLCQCVITLRVWHLFPRSCLIKWLAVTVFTVCLVVTGILGAVEYNAIKSVTNTNTNTNIILSSARLTFTFIIYVPALVVHTTMFLLTLYRFRVTPRTLQQHGMIHRFIKEGMFLYSFAAGSLLYEIISLSLTNPEDIAVSFMAITARKLITIATMAATAVSICRAMLNIRSLAATYHVDPAWLLNHAELSRVQWRRGHTEGEIYVEVSEMDVVLPSKSPALPAGNIGREDEVQNHT
ncbi:uncharacterized protein F5147DRAFT_681553 [Suillus discolor]|uniref:DUF6533 domain-containing protein n=1 Tax=Suillus discolor TaxID=1912936 RepID=A0A9P7FDI1_9AGAM|nr:uncharacterized protein F5147DRAFT_681553 [Suillus discolor]KAG2113536.1 hypothetical protein F5147DRAFT_681553 [Suillus discolor]